MLACTAFAAQAGEWQFYGGDAGGRHYSEAGQINTGNVDQLAVAWTHRSGDLERRAELMPQTSGQATPLLLPEQAGESLVYCTQFNEVIALDPGNGTERWRFDPEIDTSGERPFRCRGVAYYEEQRVADGEHCRHRLYTNTHDRRLLALDAIDGQPCRDFGKSGAVTQFGSDRGADHVSNSSAPVVAQGVVVSGSTVIDFHFAESPRGLVQAFDSLTGSLRWSFDPLQGHSGSGSANVWAPMSIDEARGLVFLPTSAPSPDYYGANRPGDNRYANSIVALDLATGEVQWHFQHVRHDLWDYDTPAQPILFDWQKNGETIPALAQPTKQGFVFVLDRRNGKSLWEITEQPVPPSQIPGEHTARTQPKPIAPPPLLDPFLMPEQAWGLTPWDRSDCAEQLAELDNLGLFTPLSEKLTLMLPGSLGGANWGGGAILGDSGVLVVNVNTTPFSGRLVPREETAGQGTSDHPAAGARMRVPMRGTPYDVEVGALVSPLGTPCSPPPWGKLVAVDLVAGKTLWEKPLGSVHDMAPFPVPFHLDWGTPNLGGGIATAGGLFFIGATMDKHIRAFDTESGEVLWRYELPVDATATPMTYTYKGRQYVVINAGGHAMFSRPQGDYLYAFALEQE
ncbi:pyrroloquinoline quinone-dependent dehydrogenase [Halioglobus maricola]|uniref:Pyrroloquinoline quinone-dependent dehydrogenase n=2 Tax=Halioglobus maricola TaxID=2601894 RepID=A0A5P9NR12_9GAMM|nr:pyrroloquinoline quinone-dependent dehydrogenase [Halioglobus maricola]